MSVCFGVILRLRINQRCACVTFVVLVRSAPSDPGVCNFSPLLSSAFCAGLSAGDIPCRLRGQDPLQGGRKDRRSAPHRAPHRLTPSTCGVSRGEGERGRSASADGEQRWECRHPPACHANVASRTGGKHWRQEQGRGGGGQPPASHANGESRAGGLCGTSAPVAHT